MAENHLTWIGVLYLISAMGSALAPEPYLFSFRFIGGLGVGASSVAAPTYISEIAPAYRRGRLVILYQFMIVLGILVAFLSNWLVGSGLGDNAWRWMLGIEVFPVALYLLLVVELQIVLVGWLSIITMRIQPNVNQSVRSKH